MVDLNELAARCEAAAGLDRELDLWIEAAVNPEYDGLTDEHAEFLVKYGGHPRHTASLDAAMTLVPEGWMQFDVDATAPDLGIDWTLHRYGIEVKATAATPALALCAAALRARTKEQA